MWIQKRLTKYIKKENAQHVRGEQKADLKVIWPPNMDIFSLDDYEMNRR